MNSARMKYKLAVKKPLQGNKQPRQKLVRLSNQNLLQQFKNALSFFAQMKVK